MARTRQPTHRPTDRDSGGAGEGVLPVWLGRKKEAKGVGRNNPKAPRATPGSPRPYTHSHTLTMFSVPQTTPNYPRRVCGEIEAIRFALRP